MATSAYRITWVEIRPSAGGVVTKRDCLKMDKFHSRDLTGYFYKWFLNREKAVDYIKELQTKQYDKEYECRLFTDKQFSLRKREDGYKVPFTTKQYNEVYLLSKMN